MSARGYFLTAGDAASQLLNAVLFNSGRANQSLSGRCYEEREHWFFGRLGRWLIDPVAGLFGNKNHCYMSYLNDVRRANELAQHFKESGGG